MRMHIEVAWQRPGDLTEDQLDTLVEALPDTHGLSVAIDDGHLYVYARFGIESDTIADAAAAALETATDAYAAAFRTAIEPVQMAVSPSALGLIPGPMDIVGTTSLGEILGTSRQYASRMAREGGMPAPLGYPSGGPVWARRAVEVVAARRADVR
jgi:hypothetical protein